MLSYEVPTTPLRQMGIDCVMGVHLLSHWTQTGAPRHFFDVIGQCFAIAQTRMRTQWEKDADMLLEPNVDGFAFDDFYRADELIALGEESMRAALPALRAKLGIAAPAQSAKKAAKEAAAKRAAAETVA
jgi:predicted acylesterase/phospholipase RssA